jgi:hypothetical protein
MSIHLGRTSEDSNTNFPSWSLTFTTMALVQVKVLEPAGELKLVWKELML